MATRRPTAPTSRARHRLRAAARATGAIPTAAASAAPHPTSVRLAFVGDINLGTTTLPDGVPPDSGRGLLDRRAARLLAGDLVVGNFEGVLADTRHLGQVRAPMRAAAEPPTSAPEAGARPPLGRHRCAVATAGCYAFRTPTALAPRLVEAGFTHLNLANNHANDFGPAGRASTERILDSLGLRRYGPLGRIAIDTRAPGRQRRPTVGLRRVHHLSIRVRPARHRAERGGGGLGPAAGGSAGRHLPRRARRASAHCTCREAAESLGREPRGDLRRWARAVIDAGADAVVGHGPHVLRGIEFYRGRPIVYSLGNFLTYRGFNLDGPAGHDRRAAARAGPRPPLPARRAWCRCPAAPCRVRPRIPTQRALELVRRLSAEDFGAAAARVTEDRRAIFRTRR